MYVRFLCSWPPYKDGQCLEVLDRVGADFVARCLAQMITAGEVKSYAQTIAAIDREVERRVSAMPSAARRVITEDQWHREIGRNMPGYWKLADRHFRQQLEFRK